MKVRIGFGTGAAVMSGDDLAGAVAALEALGFDSMWWSDVLTTPGDDPLAAMAYAAGCGTRLKVGTTMVLPGRNPVRLAKQLATLDRLSGGHLLVTFVLGLRLPGELAALGVEAGGRTPYVDEVLPLLRRLWSEDGVDHLGAHVTVRGVSVEPKPLQQPLEVWLGGSAPGALARTGRLADGWLPALCTPAEAAAGRVVVEEAAAAAGRRIDPEHFGVSIGYSRGELPARVLERVVARRARIGAIPGASGTASDDVDPRDLLPDGIGALRGLVERFVDVGFSKFVVRPVAVPESYRDELNWLADGLLALQT